MAIRVTYGPSGSLLQGALQVGQGAAFDKRFAQEQSLIQAARDDQYRREALKAQVLEADRTAQLQQQLAAAKARVSGSATVRAPGTYDKNMAESIRRKQLADQAGIPTQDQNLLNVASEYGDRETVNQILQQAGGATPATQAKKAYLSSIAQATGLPASEQAALGVLAESGDVTLSQLRMAAQQASQRAQKQSGQISPQYANVLRVRDLDTQAGALQRQMMKLEKELEEAGSFDPEGTVDQFLTPGVNRFDFGTGYRDTPATVNEAALRKMQDYRQLKVQLQQLRQQREQILGGGAEAGLGSQDSLVPGFGSKSVEDMTPDELIKAAFGG